MIAAPVPSAPLAHTVLVAGAKAKLNETLQTNGNGRYVISGCHRVSPHYGVCHFVMHLTMKSSGKKFVCTGPVKVRDIGNGPEATYGIVLCNKKRVN